MRASIRSWIYSAGPLLLIASAVAGYSYRSAVQDREAEAREWQVYDRARSLASQGNVQDSYRLYSHLCQDGQFVKGKVPRQDQPCIRSTDLDIEISFAYEAAMAALERHRMLHGSYPADLSQVKGDIPVSAMRAFAGLKLHRTTEGGIGIETGMYGPAKFSLGR